MPAPWKTRTLLIVAGTAAYWGVIFTGTHLAGGVIHEGGHSDKFFHFGAFAGLTILLCGSAASFYRMGPTLYAGIVGLAAGYGIFDELTQTLVHRTADPLDWVADVSGALVGTLIFAMAAWLFERLSTRSSAPSVDQLP